jgi:hypothetical protein
MPLRASAFISPDDREKDGMLELDAPADGGPRRLQRDERRGQDQEGDNHAGRRRNKSRPKRVPCCRAVIDESQQLQRQHRKDAGHQIQNEAAEPRGDHNRPPQAGFVLRRVSVPGIADARRCGRRVAGRQPGLDRPAAVDQRRGDVQGPQKVDRVALQQRGQHRAIARDLDLRPARIDRRRRACDKQIGMLERTGRRGLDANARRRGAHNRDRRDLKRWGGCRGDLVPPSLDQRLRIRAAGTRQIGLEDALLAHADRVAGIEDELELGARIEVGVYELNLDGKQNVSGIPDAFDTQDRGAVRHRPLHFGERQVGRCGPIEFRRHAGVARRLPIDFPARPEAHMHADPAAERIIGGGNLADDELGRDVALQWLCLRSACGRGRHDGGSGHDATDKSLRHVTLLNKGPRRAPAAAATGGRPTTRRGWLLSLAGERRWTGPRGSLARARHERDGQAIP